MDVINTFMTPEAWINAGSAAVVSGCLIYMLVRHIPESDRQWRKTVLESASVTAAAIDRATATQAESLRHLIQENKEIHAMFQKESAESRVFNQALIERIAKGEC